MPSFGDKSRRNLALIHEDLVTLAEEVVKHFDCSVIGGHRGRSEQNKLFEDGKSKLKYPKSKHNELPSEAIDLIPWPVDWSDKERFILFAGFVKGVASQMGIKIRCGIDFNNDNLINDSFFDAPHFELVL